MSIVDELRYPRRWYTKLLVIVLTLIVFIALATAAVAGVLTYWIVKPQRTSSEINMASFPGRPDEVEFTVSGLIPPDRKGWFFPGLRGAPTIILCHGYESSRGELLTLVSALQDHQYNVYVFDFAGHGANAGNTTFGYREADEVRAVGLRHGRVRGFAGSGKGCAGPCASAGFGVRLPETDGEDRRREDRRRRISTNGEIRADDIRVAQLRVQG
jgi:pimeloyl-ACP methyl ester carboxylesterase